MSSSSALSLLGPLPEGLLSSFGVAFARQQQDTVRVWRAAVAALDGVGWAEQEFVADELALVMNVHPATARSFLVDARQACAFPALMAAWEAGCLTDRHVRAGVEELHRCLTDQELRERALERVLQRCRDRAARGTGWPRPGEFRRMITAAALLLDLDAHRHREDKARQERGTHTYPLPNGQGAFALEGPAEQVLAAAKAVTARALAASKVPGETRTLPQLEFDLTVELLIHGTLDGHAQVGIELQVLVPVDTVTGDGDGLGELVGYGPLHPQTTRDLAHHATTLRRVDVDRITGRVVAVSDPVTLKKGLADAALTTLLAAPLPVRDLSTASYRPTPRALRLVKTRDQTCRFPGCTTPAERTDLDHRLPWPRGQTDPANLHCLCRHHHRAKQSGLFQVTLKPDGTTIWTLTRTGTRHHTPPPDLTAT